MVQTRQSRTLVAPKEPLSKKFRPSKSGGALNSKKRKSSVEIQIEETSSRGKRQRVEDVDVALEELETETRGAIVVGGEDVEAGGVPDEGEPEMDMDELVSDVLRYYEDVDEDDGTDDEEYVDEDDGTDEEEYENIEGSIMEKKIVQFNDKGQPIGEESVPFTTYLGSIMRKHCPISYEMWRDVPGQLKERLWKLVTDKFVVPVAYKQKVIEKINTYWRHHKCTLRLSYYDKYNTDEERKRHCPKGVRRDIWNIFVDSQSSPAAQARRNVGKLARQAMKNQQYSGRRGAARTEEALKKGNPLATVTRTELYVAVHSPKDRSGPTPVLPESVKKINAIVQQNPSSINLDVDHDPVAQVCGREKKGHIRGMGMGVSKSSLRHSAHVVALLQQERRLRVQAEQIAGLRDQQVVSQRPAPRADQNGKRRSLRVITEGQEMPTPWEQVDSPQPAPIVDLLVQERRQSFSADEHIADVSEHVVYQQQAPSVGQLEKERSVLPGEQNDQHVEMGSCHQSAEEQIDILRKQVDQLLQEREQITDLKKLIVSQGLMIADMRELIARLCS